MISLPALSPKSWRGGADSTQDMTGEYYATGAYTFILELTDWTMLRTRNGGWLWVNEEDRPLNVQAELHVVPHRYRKAWSASVSLRVSHHFVRRVADRIVVTSVASAKRQALTLIDDKQQDLVREALAAYYGGKVAGARCEVFTVDGECIAMFLDTNAAFNCSGLPRHTYHRWVDHRGDHVSEVHREHGCVSSSSSPELRARVAHLLEIRAAG